MDSIRGFHQEVIEARERKSKNLPIKQAVNKYPLKPGGASFRTHKLVQVSSSKIVYQLSIYAIIFCSIFIFVGIGISLFFGFYKKIQITDIENFENWISFVIGLVFMITGFVILYLTGKPRVFDKTSGYFYKSFTSNNKKDNKNVVHLKTIVALQIIGEYIDSDNGGYKSFELNLVLDNSKRINVVDHGKLKSIIKDAKILSEFLNTPIWHATSHIADKI